MSVKLSFILPCYNVERYIAACLDSIYAQDISEEEYEVICVNDCSTDGTRGIISKYIDEHNNLFLVDHAENLTAGGARNSGIKVARGEYIWFVDPDDMIVHNSAVSVYDAAKKNDVDIIFFNYKVVDNSNLFIKNDHTFSESEVLSGQDYIVKYFPNHFSCLCIVWRCLFRTSFLQERKLCYPIMRKAQDVVFLWKAMLVAHRVFSHEGEFYIYRDNPYSVSKNKLDAHVAFSERLLFGNEILKLLEQKDIIINEQVRCSMANTLSWCANSNFELILKMNLEQRRCYYNEMVGNKDVVESVKPYMNRKQRRVFSGFGCQNMWLLKVWLMDLWATCKR